jgi:hypothetical protein
MSNFYRLTKNPRTGEWQEAAWIDGPESRTYRVEFPDGHGFNEDEIKEFKD